MADPSTLVGGASPATFGDRLRLLRTAAGMSQEELAESAGLSVDAVSSLERGTRTRPYPATVRALAAALRLPPEEHSALVAAIPRRPRAGEHRSRTATSHTIRLPRPATTLLGRDQDVAAVTHQVVTSTGRLVTVTGVGGIGKTRLAIAVAESVGPTFRDGAAFVGLDPVLDDALILSEVARGVGLELGDIGSGSDDEILTALAAREALLVLDNLEHLRGAAHVVSLVLARCPGLRLLTTSRSPLRVNGEVEYPVGPLGLPEATATDLGALMTSPAATLFIERGRAVRSELGIGPEDARAVAGICHRLAGLPLALELAAAGLRVLNPEKLLTRLDDVMARPGAVDLPARQSTLRATLDWSYGLLSPRDQRVFRRSSVFVGGFTLEAVEAVDDDPDTLGAVERLAAHSLLRVRAADTEPRYAMLEPVAQYARSLLVGAEGMAASTAHADYFLALAEQAGEGYRQPQQVDWLSRVETEDKNLWSALDWAVSTRRAELAARFVAALWPYWWIRGQRAPKLRLVEEVLALDLPDALRARVLVGAAALADPRSDVHTIESRCLEARSLAEPCGDHEIVADATSGAGLAALERGDAVTAEHRFQDALSAARRAGERGEWSAVQALIFLGRARRLQKDPAGGAVSIRQGLDMARGRSDALVTCLALHSLARAELDMGQTDLAHGHLVEAAALCEVTGDAANLSLVMDALAVVESSRGNAERVARLLGAAEMLRELIGFGVYGYYPADRERREVAAAESRRTLGEEAYRRALDAGHDLSFEEAVRLAQRGAAVDA